MSADPDEKLREQAAAEEQFLYSGPSAPIPTRGAAELLGAVKALHNEHPGWSPAKLRGEAERVLSEESGLRTASLRAPTGDQTEAEPESVSKTETGGAA